VTLNANAVAKRFTVQDRNAAKTIFDAKQRNLFRPFLEGPCTISDAAKVTEATIATVSAFVKRCVRQELLRGSDQVLRAGRSVWRYQSVAEELFIPLELAEEFLLLPERQWQRRFEEALVDCAVSFNYTIRPTGLVLRRRENGAMELTPEVDGAPSDKPGNGPQLYFDRVALKLRPEDVETILADLKALENKYLAMPLGTESFYLGTTFVPVPPHQDPAISNGQRGLPSFWLTLSM
jgi:hypothetical protein